MDKIQKFLVTAGRKDLAQEYYEKTAVVNNPIEKNQQEAGGGILHIYTYADKIDAQIGIYFPQRTPRDLRVKLTMPSRPFVDKFVQNTMGSAGKKIFNYTGEVSGIKEPVQVFVATQKLARPFQTNAIIKLTDPIIKTKSISERTEKKIEQKMPS